MNRRTFQRGLLLSAFSTSCLLGLQEQPAEQTLAQGPAPFKLCRRGVTEYELPLTTQTHEIIRVPARPLVLVSQMSNSNLVKIWLDPQSEQVTGVQAFPLGSPNSMLHGLAVSARYPGKVWATHEADNRLLLIDPGIDKLETAPTIIRTVEIPAGGKGPHSVQEYGDFLWVTLKESDQVLAINHTNPRRYRFYPALAHPIFVIQHPRSGEFYVSQDQANKILRINATTQATTQIAVPSTSGTTPVGLAAGPNGVWVTLLGTKDQGAGTFGCIGANGTIAWFKLTAPEARNAGLLHLAFDPAGSGREPGVWLLGSSIISPNALDAIIHVVFDNTYTHIQSEAVAALPTQLCKAHRLLPLNTCVLATELTSATLARLEVASGCSWDRLTTPTTGNVS